MIHLDARMIEMSGIGTYIKNIAVDTGIYGRVLGDRAQLCGYFDSGDIIDFDAKIYGHSEQIKFPYKAVGRGGVLHCPHYNIPLLYRGKLAVTIHDITHIKYPQYLPNKAALSYAKFMITAAIKKSSVIFTDSENTKNDLIEHFRVKSDRIKVIYCATASFFRVKEKQEYEGLKDKYSINPSKKIILYVGNKKPHKNLEKLLYAFDKLKLKDDCVLVLVGKSFDNYKNLEDIAEKLDLNKQIVHTGFISDDELVSLYNLADVFVFPSLYEGFGLPPLEAMACGTPVVCSNTSSLPEVVGDAAYLIDPMDIASMAKGIDEVLVNSELRESLISKGFEQVKLFSWEKAVEDTRKELNVILDENTGA